MTRSITLQSIITCQKAAILHSKRERFRKPHEACKRVKRNLYMLVARNRTLEKNFFSTTDKTNYLTNLQKETGCFESKNRLFFLAKA